MWEETDDALMSDEECEDSNQFCSSAMSKEEMFQWVTPILGQVLQTSVLTMSAADLNFNFCSCNSSTSHAKRSS